MAWGGFSLLALTSPVTWGPQTAALEPGEEQLLLLKLPVAGGRVAVRRLARGRPAPSSGPHRGGGDPRGSGTAVCGLGWLSGVAEMAMTWRGRNRWQPDAPLRVPGR